MSPVCTPNKKYRQRNLSGFGVATSSTMKEKLDNQIAKLFYSCNLAFNIADQDVFRETIEMLRPGYSPPNRKDIGEHLLDSVHNKLQDKMKEEL